MPILNGFEACEKITQFIDIVIEHQNLMKFELNDSKFEKKSSSSSLWIDDLKSVFN